MREQQPPVGARITIVTTACEDDPDPPLGVGRSHCAACGREVWVSRSSLESLVRHAGPANVLCQLCGLPALAKSRDPVGILPGARAELADEVGPVEADRCIDDIDDLTRFLRRAQN